MIEHFERAGHTLGSALQAQLQSQLAEQRSARRWKIFFRLAWLVLFAVAAASLVQVRSGEATVITRFGNPARVLLEPGLGWRWPAR